MSATPYRCRQLANMVRSGDVVRVGEVADLLEEMAIIKEAIGWQSDKPTDGKWHLSHRPDRRGANPAVVKVVVAGESVRFNDGSTCSLSHSQFVGALWRRRDNLADPWKK